MVEDINSDTNDHTKQFDHNISDSMPSTHTINTIVHNPFNSSDHHHHTAVDNVRLEPSGHDAAPESESQLSFDTNNNNTAVDHDNNVHNIVKHESSDDIESKQTQQSNPPPNMGIDAIDPGSTDTTVSTTQQLSPVHTSNGNHMMNSNSSKHNTPNEYDRKRRRRTAELTAKELWRCPNNGCTKVYKRTSTISVNVHKKNCTYGYTTVYNKYNINNQSQHHTTNNNPPYIQYIQPITLPHNDNNMPSRHYQQSNNYYTFTPQQSYRYMIPFTANVPQQPYYMPPTPIASSALPLTQNNNGMIEPVLLSNDQQYIHKSISNATCGNDNNDHSTSTTASSTLNTTNSLPADKPSTSVHSTLPYHQYSPFYSPNQKLLYPQYPQYTMINSSMPPTASIPPILPLYMTQYGTSMLYAHRQNNLTSIQNTINSKDNTAINHNPSDNTAVNVVTGESDNGVDNDNDSNSADNEDTKSDDILITNKILPIHESTDALPVVAEVPT